MRDSDKPDFLVALKGVHDFYRQDLSKFAGSVWWSAMQPYDLAAVVDALGRHAMNPDGGQFMPKPADVVKMLSGSTADAALQAWANVDRAVRVIGTYRDVGFDDALIHRVVYEMGGWIEFGRKTEDEWPFVRNEFVTRYRGYRMRSMAPDYPRVLVGIANAANSEKGMTQEPPVLIGNPEVASRVVAGGAVTPLLQFTPATAVMALESH